MSLLQEYGISCVTVKSVNVYLIRTGNGIVVFDAGPKDSASRIMRQIEKGGYGHDDVKLIIISHSHNDHFSGASELRELTGAPVAAHPLDAPYIEAGRNPEVQITENLSTDVIKFINEKAGKQFPPCKVDIRMDRNFDPADFSLTGKIVETPGHTYGSVSYILNDIALTADILTSRLMEPNTPRIPMFAYDINEIFKSIKKILSYDVKCLYPSHGGCFTFDSVNAFIKRESETE
ncbi:MAG: MBL fold metallo-hydrolase [Chitinivibrionales bacterium]